MHTTDHHEREYLARRAGPPSPAHVAELQRLGYTGPTPRTQAEASRLVNEQARRLAGQRVSAP